MKIFIFLVLTVLSTQLFAANYGFLNLDNRNYSCFVGVNEDSLEFSGVVSNRFFTDDQIDLMNQCKDEKAQGQPAVIKVWTTSNTQPSEITTHLPDFHVDCVYLRNENFSEFLALWRDEVSNSNFRRCF